MTLSNLPPGVTDNMIPGNRPEDIAFEKWYESLSEEDIVKLLQEFVSLQTMKDIIVDFILEDNDSIKRGYTLTLLISSLKDTFLNNKFDEASNEKD